MKERAGERERWSHVSKNSFWGVAWNCRVASPSRGGRHRRRHRRRSALLRGRRRRSALLKGLDHSRGQSETNEQSYMFLEVGSSNPDSQSPQIESMRLVQWVRSVSHPITGLQRRQMLSSTRLR